MGLTIKVAGTKAQAYELKSTKKYVFVLADDVEPADAHRAAEILRAHGIQATVCSGAVRLKIHVLD